MASSSTATASASSSADDTDRHHGLVPSPPPPTPSNHSLSNSFPSDADASFSRLLHQLLVPPALSQPSLPRRRSLIEPYPPVVPFDHAPESGLLLSAASDFGFFHLSGHGVDGDLAASALDESESLFCSHSISVNNMASVGFHNEDFDDGDGDSIDRSGRDRVLVLDASGNGEGEVLSSLPALREFGECLQKLGFAVVEMLSSMEEGFCGNPFQKEIYKPRCLLWVTSHGKDTNTARFGPQMAKSKCYPYVVGLQYEMRWWRKPYRAIGDSGELITITPVPDSILVTLGDIAQVWSNGKFKKVRSRPQPTSVPYDGGDDSSCISLTLLLTLQLDCIISPLMPSSEECSFDDDGGDNVGDNGRRKFHGFCLEEYAWRVYNERLPVKEPLLRYRI
ncbi:gibberellin 2-beta-dioxygenase 1-like [Zingiber officinale]|uniref:Isopenicillin N synthase-like Fe(2+) 2OG dioxygenase domain-containing protein n=1 Tax=Zingiber officinale TaxID=94328 RepID=A0A8J5GDW1_ZINOF|nr:gibberellin 2-beta-dioxygenase 1-like [Zingiber officinale]KAG6500143.1 hypothetical protein ZIOFF_039959 [Zingiber officinale]